MPSLVMCTNIGTIYACKWFLADKFGTKKVFIFSLILFSLGSLLCSLSPNLSFFSGGKSSARNYGSLMTPVGKLALIKTLTKWGC